MRNLGRIAILLILLAALVGTVSADDGRINLPPYHLGGDTLYCDSASGCTLLNMNGQFLFNWPQGDVGSAIAAADESGENQLVGSGVGTYGEAQLWVVFSGPNADAKTLCLVGHDEHYKMNEFCFKMFADGVYEQAPVAVQMVDCSMWRAGMFVLLNGYNLSPIVPQAFGWMIIEVYPNSGTVLLEDKGGKQFVVGCDQIHGGLT